MITGLVERGVTTGKHLLITSTVVLAVASMIVLAQPPQSRVDELESGELFTEMVGPQRPGVPVNAQLPQIERFSVLVHLERELERECNERQAVRTFAGECGANVKYEYKNVLPNVLFLQDVPTGEIERLKRMPGVTKVELDREVHAYLQDGVPLIRGLQTQITAAGISANGTGARVCIIDTGIDTDHTMYNARIDSAAGWDFVNNDAIPEDDNGHGTNVAGIAVGGVGTIDVGCGVVPFQGVAPNATLIGVKVLDAGGGGSFANVIAGIDHCASPTLPGGRADVINLSLGGGQFVGACDTDTGAIAANNAVAAGVVVVAASGNDGFANSMGTPACGSSVIAVGAVYDDTFPTCEHPTQTSFSWCLDSFCISTCTDNAPPVDSLICFSNQSDQLDVTAPGCNARSASNAPGGTSTAEQCGTSQATPHVTGLAALIRGLDPSLTPAQVRQVIRDGAIDLGPVGFDNGYGWGRIDVINSLQLVAPAPGCSINADCDDGLSCNGVETCLAGTCQAGTAINCDDGISCTLDSCVDPLGSCTNTPDNGLCGDGNACTTDVCDVVTGCSFTPFAPCCGNSTCEVGENCNTCSGDCFSGGSTPASCGNGICEPFAAENCKDCPQDCNGVQSGGNRFCCGDGSGNGAVTCADPRCTATGFQCSETAAPASCCGDLICEGTENNTNCAVDCGPPAVCGDLVCDAGEDQCNCAFDCGNPPATETSCNDGVDNDCDGLTDCDDADCSADPACIVPFCGDATCDANEDQCNCAADCGTPPATETSCTDGVDNDCDGFTDCSDADCNADPACSCLPKKAFCTSDIQCCSGNCRLDKNECK